MRILGLGGDKGSGKSYVAEKIKIYLDHNYQKKVIIFPFAKPLKDACTAMFGYEGLVNPFFIGDKAKETTFWKERLGDEYENYRKILVSIGTKVFRNTVHTNFWVWAMQKNLIDLAAKENPFLVIIDDVRFENETKFIINECNGHCINIVRPGTIRDAHDIAENSIDRSLWMTFFNGDKNIDVDSLVKVALKLKECPNVFSR